MSLEWCIFFFKQKTAYEMRISDWSSDVCSSDLRNRGVAQVQAAERCNRRGKYALAHADSPQSIEAWAPLGPAVVALCMVSRLPILTRSEERRVGKEFVRTCRSRWTPYH